MANKRNSMRSRRLRWYTTGVAVVSGGAVAIAIGMNSAAADAQKARRQVAEYRDYARQLKLHTDQTTTATVALLKQYRKVVADADAQQRRMLADLRKARKAAQKATKINLAPVSYAINTSYAGPSVSAGPGGAPSSGSS